MAVAKKSSIMTPELAAVLANEYAVLTKQESQIKTRKKELSDKLKSFAEIHGIADEKGSKRIDLGGFIVGRVAKHKQVLMENSATNYFKSRKLFSQVTETVVRFVPEKIEALYAEGKIPDEDLTQIYEDEVSYSIEVKALSTEAMPDVQVAALEKPKLKFGKK